MRKRLTSTCASRSFVLLVAVWGSGCSDKITVQNTTNPAENRPPIIVRQGPALPAGPIDVRASGKQLFVIVADPDGLDDISGVFVDIGSVLLHRVIARPGVPNAFGCENLSYAANDTLDIMPVMTTSYAGISACPLGRNGAYCEIQSFY